MGGQRHDFARGVPEQLENLCGALAGAVRTAVARQHAIAVRQAQQRTRLEVPVAGRLCGFENALRSLPASLHVAVVERGVRAAQERIKFLVVPFVLLNSHGLILLEKPALLDARAKLRAAPS